MSMSIDLHVYDEEKVLHVLDKIAKDDAEKALFRKAMQEFGIVAKGTWSVQSTDYWDEYSPLREFERLVECLHNDVDMYELLKQCSLGWIYQGQNAAEWYSEATGLDLPAHRDDDDDDNE